MDWPSILSHVAGQGKWHKAGSWSVLNRTQWAKHPMWHCSRESQQGQQHCVQFKKGEGKSQYLDWLQWRICLVGPQFVPCHIKNSFLLLGKLSSLERRCWNLSFNSDFPNFIYWHIIFIFFLVISMKYLPYCLLSNSLELTHILFKYQPYFNAK